MGLLFGLILLVLPSSARADDVLCDPAFEDCRAKLLTLIRNETRGIDVSFWFMEDNRYSVELIRRHQAGVPVRVIIDPRANSTYPLNADRLAELAAAGVPMRKRITGGILHYKMMLFDGQNTLEFSGANYSPWAFSPVEPYENYTDEAIYFTDDSSVVNSFRSKFDSLWINTTQYADYANITAPPARRYDVFTKDPELNFPPLESYRNRSIKAYDAETTAIDVIMFRITDKTQSDAMIRTVTRGVPVRLITDPQQYREPSRLWHSWNVDRMYMAGVQVRMSAHQGVNHQKSVILKNQGMVIFGSSNWTSPSTDSQEEHNYFTKKLPFYNWFIDQFERKWNNLTGHLETKPFVPLPPDKPVYITPSHLANGVPTTGAVLKWNGGLWAHKYDVYFGTTSTPPLVQENLELGPSETSTQLKSFALPALQPGTTYYWRVVSKTFADQPAAGPIQAFTTAGTPPPPPPTGETGAGDIVLYAGRAPVKAGSATVVNDVTAAGGTRMSLPNANAAKVAAPVADPASYFEMTFDAQAGIPYRLWIRGKAQSDYWGNDSVFVQFSNAVTDSGASTWGIGTTSGTSVNLEDCSGCGLSGWGWQDNGYGTGVLGPLVKFGASGTQTIRFQIREDGLSIDQIVLSPSRYLTTSPGNFKDDATILPAASGGTTPPPDEPPPPPPAPTGGGDEVVLWAGRATSFAGAWAPSPDSTAAGALAMFHPDAGAAKVATAAATPANYFELTFNAVAGKPYRIWIRGRAQGDSWANDSVFVQFSGSVNASGLPIWRIGTTEATWVSIEEGSNMGLAGWGWADNGYGVNVAGPVVYFETTGTHTIRIQTREDGLMIDQIVLSSGTYLSASPGATKNDTTILGGS